MFGYGMWSARRIHEVYYCQDVAEMAVILTQGFLSSVGKR